MITVSPAAVRRVASHALAIALMVVLVAGLSSCATDQSRRQAAAWTDIGNAWSELGRWDKAGDAWSRAVAIDPGQAVAGYNLVRALAEAGKYDDAIATADRYLSSDPDNAAVLSIKAYALHKAGRDREAIVVYRRVVVLNGGDSASQYNLAVLLESSGQTDEALALYDAILAAKPDAAAAAFRKGMLLSAMGNVQEAIPLIERYVGAHDASLEAQRALALAYERAGRFADAMDKYALVTGRDATDAASWFALSRLRLTVAADAKGGLEALKSALQHGFADKERAAALLAAPALVEADDVRAVLGAAGLLAESTDSGATETP